MLTLFPTSSSVHWIVPTIAGSLLATSLLLIFVGYLNYLVDTYLMYAASAIAANTIARSACGAAAPLFTNQMFDALGVGGGGSLIGGVAALLAIIPFTFYRYGKAIRVKSRFAPTNIRKKPTDEEKAPVPLKTRVSLTDQASTPLPPPPVEMLDTTDSTPEQDTDSKQGRDTDSTTDSTQGLETDDGPSGSGSGGEKKEERV